MEHHRGAGTHGLRLVLIVMLAFAPLAQAADAALTILTGRASTPLYPLGVALARAAGQIVPPVRVTAQTTKNSAENLARLQETRAEFGFTLGDTLSEAWRGDADAGFSAPLRKLRGIASLYPNYIQIVARADSGIRTLADLRGKNVSVGVQRSGVEFNARAIFAAAGLRYKDFRRLDYLPFGESVEMMKGRQLDATLQSAGLAASALRDLATSVDIVVIPIPPDVVRKMRDPAFLSGTIPANTYRGQASAVATAIVQNLLVTHEDVSDDTVYAMTKALWTHLDQLVAAHPVAKSIELRHALTGMAIPLHAGAERYYREVGVLK